MVLRRLLLVIQCTCGKCITEEDSFGLRRRMFLSAEHAAWQLIQSLLKRRICLNQLLKFKMHSLGWRDYTFIIANEVTQVVVIIFRLEKLLAFDSKCF